MRETVIAADARGVGIGAHPSYPDITGFGRRELGLTPSEIARHVSVQIRALRDVATAMGARVAHVKPHGALYNRAARDAKAARAIADAMRELDPTLILLGLPGSEMMRAADEAGIPFAGEAFADRAYTADLLLMPRGREGAVIEDAATAAATAVELATRRTMRTSEGKELPLEAASLCVHGDTVNALTMLRTVRAALESAGVRIARFGS